MPTSDIPEINDSDFQSIELICYIRHAHTGTELRDPSRIKVIELGEKEITLEIPPKTFASGHYLVLGISARGLPPEKTMKPFVTEAKIESVVNLDGADQLRLSLTQFEPEKWEELKRLFSSRQNEIERFFKNVRGED